MARFKVAVELTSFKLQTIKNALVAGAAIVMCMRKLCSRKECEAAQPFLVQGADGQWVHKVVIKQEWPKMVGWALPTLSPLITDILISLDDKFLYFSNW